jgi:DNA-binding response OmpR family regulator
MLVEDDLVLADGLAKVLEGAGLDVEVVTGGDPADALLARESFDLLLLDIGLPGLDGFEVLRRLRERGSVMPVLLLTARDEISDRVHGFDLGADDYVVKPFAIPELLARVRALLRRGGQRQTDKLTHGPLTMDLTARRVWLNGEPVELSVREWSVLEHLLRNTDKVVSKQQLTQALAGSEGALSQNAAEVYMFRLRAKLESSGVRIRTIHGFGYMIASWKS